jgi:hypothetical protein
MFSAHFSSFFKGNKCNKNKQIMLFYRCKVCYKTSKKNARRVTGVEVKQEF